LLVGGHGTAEPLDGYAGMLPITTDELKSGDRNSSKYSNEANSNVRHGRYFDGLDRSELPDLKSTSNCHERSRRKQ
jgi:hypothetical protein